jgi:predicted DNA-binding transcriptional regulator AlpA
MKRLINARQLAEHWGVSHMYIYRLIEKGLPYRKEQQHNRVVKKFNLDKCNEWREKNSY